jgi:hypothetical protein
MYAIARTNTVVEDAENPDVFTNRTGNHCAVPQTYWKELIARAECLKTK